MSISLVKGQKIDLTKGNSGLSKIMVGLGWDAVDTKSSGLKGLFAAKPAEVDCDASVIMLDANNKLSNKKDLIYFGNLKGADNSVVHQGDNLTGAGDGDDEMIMVDLSKVPTRLQKLVFVVNIYDCQKRKQDFGMIKNAFIRVVDLNGKKEMMKFNLTDDYAGKTSIVVGEIYKDSTNEWKFNAVGQGTNDTSLSGIVKKYK